MKVIDNQKDRLENIEDVKKEEDDKDKKKILPQKCLQRIVQLFENMDDENKGCK